MSKTFLINDEMLPDSEIAFKFKFLQTNPLSDTKECSDYTTKRGPTSFFVDEALEFSTGSQLR